MTRNPTAPASISHSTDTAAVPLTANLLPARPGRPTPLVETPMRPTALFNPAATPLPPQPDRWARAGVEPTVEELIDRKSVV